jgi:cell division protein FtsN
LKCHSSRPPVPEERQINRLHAEVVKRRKDRAEATAERKRKRKAKHDKACKIARAEGKPRPATPESTDEEEEDASDAEGHLLGDDGAAAGAGSPPTYQWDVDEGAPASLGETRTAAESSVDPSLEGGEAGVAPAGGG